MARLLAVLFAGLLLTSGPASGQSGYDAAFRQFLRSEIVPEARRAGVSEKALSRELSGLTLDTSLPGLAKPGQGNVPPQINYQSEFRAPSRYFSDKQFNSLVSSGRTLAQKYASQIAAIEKRYGVPGRIILAIWARESGYGRAKIPHDALRVMATRAFMGQRQDFYRGELIAALKILDNGDISRSGFRSSWGGALGQPQFLPSSFLKYAVDFDGDGHRDIWRSDVDTMASIGHYLQQHGWVTGRDWGYEVEVPASVSCTREGPDRGQPISEWMREGVKRVAGREFPGAEQRRKGYLLMPAGRYGPGFLATENFYVLKEYNESDVYALFVGHLADRYGRNAGFVQSWSRIPTATRGAVRKLQLQLEAQGHDVGGADGLIGFKTRRSLGAWQEASGRAPRCWID